MKRGPDRPRVVVLGGGFAGLTFARKMKRAPVDLLLIDRTNHHLFQPLLYQVASAALSPADIAHPLRQILRRQKNATVLMAEVESIDTESQELRLSSGESVDYDLLVVAVGARHSYFGHPEWEQHAPGIKTLEDALLIRRRILESFERAERKRLQDKDADISAERTFVVVGAGPTGVEIAGAIAEIAHQTLRQNFRGLDPASTRVHLVEAAHQVLPPFPHDLGLSAERQLETLGVNVHLETRVSNIDGDGVTLETGGSESRIQSSNVIWAAGNQAPSLLASLGAELDRQGRVIVAPDLSVPGCPGVFVLGDAAHLRGPDGSSLPGVAQVAMQQGKYLSRQLKDGVQPEAPPAFRYKDPGTMATIGRARAVAWIGRVHASGFGAWLLWSLLHVFFLIGFRNRSRVMLEWAYWYFTGRRGARLLFRSTRARSFE